jgi:serine/threonine protein kinase/tetratricopeptide (TPR) repeat protein
VNELDLLTEVLSRTDPADRATFLDQACAGNPELRRRLEELLAGQAREGSTLDQPPVAPAGLGATVDLPTAIATGEHRPDGATQAFSQPDPDATTAPGSEAPTPRTAKVPTGEGIGTVIAGRYTLVEVIGEGGMGSVYLASQTDPVKRQVALKLIKTGMDSRGVLARFDAERQALALMDHPNIARIYDGGLTPAGQPFFVMELVKGVPLTEYCDQKRLTVNARLELFVAVCQAVQHAHQKGIIHRDLKPGNVLVTEVDGRPTPKVIDFGVAKATEVKLTDMSFADVGAIVGTPTYMSPEQADPSSMDIDTRTDVYALGVILYELLVGSPPLEARDFRRGAILEMLRMVREVDPPRPSNKLSTAEALPNIAANRSIEPARLSKLLHGELDWVVMKALEKDRDRRYDTANGFARDVQRYLADEVVEARPPSRGYRLKKFVKRNKGQVIAASLIFLALVGGIVGTSIGLYQADRAREAADRAREDEATQRKIAVEEKRKAEASEAVAKLQRTRAETREEQAIDAVKKFGEVVADNPELKNNPALESLRKTLLKEPLAFFRSLRAGLQSDADTNPESIARLADVAHDYAHITEEIGDKEDSLRGHFESQQIWERLTRDHPQNTEFQAGLARVYFCQGKLLGDTGRLVEAKRSYESAVAIYGRLSNANPGDTNLRKQFALSQLRRGTLLEDSAKPIEAMKAYESAAAIFENLINANPTDLNDLLNYQTDLAGTYMNMGVLQKNTGQPDEALKSFEKALPIFRKLGQDFPGNVQAQSNLGGIYQNVGTLHWETGNSAAAMISLKSALGIWRKLTEDNPTVTEFQNNLASNHMLIAILQNGTEALESQEQAVAILKKLVAAHPTVTAFRYNLAGVLTNMAGNQHNMANVLKSKGDKAEALALFEKARSNSEAAVRADRANIQAQVNLSKHHWAIGKLLDETGKPAEAMQSFERAMAIRKKLADENPADTGSLMTLANYHNDIGILRKSQGNPDEAMASYEQCRAISERLTRNHPESPEFACCFAGALSNMSEIDIDAKRFNEARARLRQAITLQKKALAIAPMHPTCRAYLKEHLDLLIKVAKELGRAQEAAVAERALQDLKAGNPGVATLDAQLTELLKGDAP